MDMKILNVSSFLLDSTSNNIAKAHDMLRGEGLDPEILRKIEDAYINIGVAYSCIAKILYSERSEKEKGETADGI